MKAQERVPELLKLVAGLDQREAVELLTDAIKVVLGQNGSLQAAKVAPFLHLDDLAWIRAGRPSRIDRDPEVKAFVTSQLGTHTYDQIVNECRKRFGKERSPSRSGIGRFVARCRSALREVERGDG